MKNFTMGVVVTIYQNKNSDYRILIPKKMITGIEKTDDLGTFIGTEEQKYYLFNNNLDEKECYIFPITYDEFMTDYLDTKGLEQADYVEADYLEEVMNMYVNEVAENTFYSKHDYVVDETRFYRIDINTDSIYEIDPKLNFWKACSYEVPLTEKIDYQEQKEKTKISVAFLLFLWYTYNEFRR